MHLLAEASIHIQRPALEVFQYVSNMERFGEWFPGVTAIQSSNALPHGQPGKEYLETAYVPLRGNRKIKVLVREVRGHQFFATEGRFPPLLPRMEITLDDTGASTCDLTYRVFSRSNSLITQYTVILIARRVMRKRAALGVATLKRRMEEGGELP